MGNSTLSIAWRNLGRNRKRTILAVSAIALGQFTLVFINCMMAGMYGDMLETITGPLIGHVQVHHPMWREERAMDLYIDDLAAAMSSIREIPDVTAVSPRIYSPVLVASGEEVREPADADTGMIVGVDVPTEVEKHGILESLSEEELPGNGRVAVGKVLARRLGIGVGQTIAVIGQDVDEFPASDLFEVAAVVRSMTDVVNRMGIVMSLSDAGEFLAMPDHAHELVVQGVDPRKAEDMADAVAGLPELEETEVLPWKEAAPELVRLVEMKDIVDLIFVLILFVAAAAGIVNTMMMSTFERTHEFGMLLAVGARPRRIVGMVVLESIILGLLGVAIGSVIGTALVLWTSHTGIDYAALTNVKESDLDFAFKGLNISYVLYPKFEWRHLSFGVIAVTLTSVLAALWPALRASRLEAAEAMKS